MSKASPKNEIWYALYTKSRAEKKLAQELSDKGIEHYLPLKKQLRAWSDRKKWVETPLFSSYIFVRVSTRTYYEAINSSYAVCYVAAGGKAIAIPEKQIAALKLFLADENRKIDISNTDLEVGNKVSVIFGPLAGAEGEIIELRGKHRLVLRFDTIGSCVTTEIQTDEVKFLE